MVDKSYTINTLAQNLKSAGIKLPDRDVEKIQEMANRVIAVRRELDDENSMLRLTPEEYESKLSDFNTIYCDLNRIARIIRIYIKNISSHKVQGYKTVSISEMERTYLKKSKIFHESQC